MTDRIVVLLPLSVTVAAKLMIAVDDTWPGARMVDANDDEQQHGDVLVFEVDDG